MNRPSYTIPLTGVIERMLEYDEENNPESEAVPVCIHLESWCEEYENRAIRHPHDSSGEEEKELYLLHELIGLEEPVLPVREFNIRLDYPMMEPTTFNVKLGPDTPFGQSPINTTSLYELVSSIADCYRESYALENELATETIYWVNYICNECHFTGTVRGPWVGKVFEGELEEGVEDCSICYNALAGNSPVRLDCSHFFHKECIERWVIDHQGRGCPLCRGPIGSDAQCRNCTSGVVRTEERWRERPTYIGNGERNLTDGPFRLHTYYLGDLFLRDIVYVRATNTVHLAIETFRFSDEVW